MAGNFVKIRRGILQHLLEHKMSTNQFTVFQLIVLLADASTGVWWGDAPVITTYLTDLSLKSAQNALASLEAKGYIKRFRQQGSRSTYPILVNKYEITVGGVKGFLTDGSEVGLKGYLTNAEQTVDWRNPVVGIGSEDGSDTGSGPRSEGGTPYSRSQENKTTRDAISTPDTETPDAPQVSPEAEPKAKTPDASDPEWKPEYQKPEEVPREKQAFYLTRRLFRCLDSPKNYVPDLKDWERELDPLCDRFDFPEMYRAIKWAVREDTYWSQYIRRAANLVKNANKVMDAYRAHLRGKATHERFVKQAKDEKAKPAPSAVKTAPSNYGTGKIELQGGEKL